MTYAVQSSSGSLRPPVDRAPGPTRPSVALIHSPGADNPLESPSGVELAGDRELRACHSAGELLERAVHCGLADRIFVDCSGSPDAIDDTARRLIRRITQVTLAPVVGWCRVASADAIQGAYAAGARSFVIVDRPATREARLSEADWAAWMRETYGLRVDERTELTLALLAGSGELAALARKLAGLRRVGSPARGSALLRRYAKALADEEHRHAPLVAAQAHLALVRLSHVRPLRVRPWEPFSVARAGRLAEQAPSRAWGALLSEAERTDLHDLTARVASLREISDQDVGAPLAGAAEDQRRWAALRVARGRDGVGALDAATEAVLERATAGARSVWDVACGGAVPPHVAAATAVRAAAELRPSQRPAGLTVTGGVARWNGASAAQLAADGAGSGADELNAIRLEIEEALRAQLR